MMPKRKAEGPRPDELELTKVLAYAGYVLVTFELIRSMIIAPIRSFYNKTSFESGPFKTYAVDVLKRHKNEFEACLLYLKDFMQAIDEADVKVIQSLRNHRNDLAHNLPERLSVSHIEANSFLLEKVKDVIFKLSNYRTYMEIGQEPDLKGINWESVKGHEYLILETIINNVKIIRQ